jgi:hypothetical protein
MASGQLEEKFILPEQTRLCTPPAGGLKARAATLGLTLATAIREHCARCITVDNAHRSRPRTHAGREGGVAMTALIALGKTQVTIILIALAAIIIVALIAMQIAKRRKA